MTRASGLAGDSVDVAAVTKTSELTRIADESSARTVRQGTLEAAARADRDAQRAAAAQAALASIEPSALSDARRSAAIDRKAYPLAQE